MKNSLKLSLILPFLSLMTMTSCKKDSIVSKDKTVENKSTEQTVKNVNENFWQFTQTLNKALILPEVRAFLKKEALKKFDDDYDILYSNVKNEKLSTGKTFEEVLLSFGKLPQLSTDNDLKGGSPDNLLNIYVYTPEFNPKTWNVETTTPKVALTPDVDFEKEATPIPAMDKEGKLSYFDSQTAPNEVVLVIGYNERTNRRGEVKEFVKTTPIEGTPLKTRMFRFQGQPENLWQINIPNLGAIESWVKGSPELKCIPVAHAIGDLTAFEIRDIDRSEFASHKWYRCDKSVLANWHTNVQGNFIRYHWYEEDDGWPGYYTTRSFSFIKPNGDTYNYDLTHWSYDDILGFGTVFFTDIIWADYRAEKDGMAIRFYSGNY
jgi:hypothetical protein